METVVVVREKYLELWCWHQWVVNEVEENVFGRVGVALDVW